MNLIKVTINLPTDLVIRWRIAANKLGMSMTEFLCRSIQTELFLFNEENSGSKILIEKNNKLFQLFRR